MAIRKGMMTMTTSLTWWKARRSIARLNKFSWHMIGAGDGASREERQATFHRQGSTLCMRGLQKA